MALVGSVVMSAPLPAQEEVGGLQVSAALQERLSRVNDEWLIWNSAFLQGDRVVADEALRDLLFTVDSLGMSGLPEVSHAMIARGVDAAREGDSVRAQWALEHAERLSPGSPEVLFGLGRVAALSGGYVGALVNWIRGYAEMLDDEGRRFLWFQNIMLWGLFSLVLSGAVFVAVELAAKGGRVYRDVAGSLGRTLPTLLAWGLGLVLLAWPFLLPNGWIWLMLYWSVLLWRHCSVAERWVLAVICVVLAIAPALALQQKRSVQLALSDQMRAIDAIGRGDLYGRLLVDVGRLQATLPESSAVHHFIADTHHKLGQDQIARPLYAQQLVLEPENAAALNNLGLFHKERREYFRAIEFFKQAAELEPGLVIPRYNLSQSYRDLLEFEEADTWLGAAQALDSVQVSQWIDESQGALPMFGGFARRSEIEDELARDWLGDTSGLLSAWVSNAGWAPVALLVPLLGFGLSRFLAANPASRQPIGDSFFDRLVRWAVPGLVWAEDDQGVRAFLTILFPVAIACMPLAGRLGYRLPWGYEPGNVVPWAVSLALLGVFYLVRLPLLFR